MAPVATVARQTYADAKAAKKAANRAAHAAAKKAERAAALPAMPKVATSHPFFRRWTPEEKEAVWSAILDAIRGGASYRAACTAQGVDGPSYWREWVRHGREGDLDEARQAQAEVHVERASDRVDSLFRVERAELTTADVMRTRVGLEHDRWMAAVTAPRRYGPKVQVEKRVTKLVVELRDESGAGYRIGQGDA